MILETKSSITTYLFFLHYYDITTPLELLFSKRKSFKKLQFDPGSPQNPLK